MLSGLQVHMLPHVHIHTCTSASAQTHTHTETRIGSHYLRMLECITINES